MLGLTAYWTSMFTVPACTCFATERREVASEETLSCKKTLKKWMRKGNDRRIEVVNWSPPNNYVTAQ